MREASRHEFPGARPTDRELIADLEGDFAAQPAQHVGDLIAVAVKVEYRLVPAGAVSSNSVLSPVWPPTSLSAAERPYALASGFLPKCIVLQDNRRDAAYAIFG